MRARPPAAASSPGNPYCAFCWENSMVTARRILDRIANLLSHRESIIGIWPFYLRSYGMDCRSMECNDRGAARAGALRQDHSPTVGQLSADSLPGLGQTPRKSREMASK